MAQIRTQGHMSYKELVLWGTVMFIWELGLAQFSTGHVWISLTVNKLTGHANSLRCVPFRSHFPALFVQYVG